MGAHGGRAETRRRAETEGGGCPAATRAGNCRKYQQRLVLVCVDLELQMDRKMHVWQLTQPPVLNKDC